MRFLLALLLFAGTCSAQVLINVGTVANDGTGDTLRLAMGKANTNFTTAFLNIITGSNLVGVVSGNLTTVSNRVIVDIANLTTVSNNVTTVSANVSAVAANLTTVSNSVGTVAANLTTVSNNVTAVTATAAPLIPANSLSGGTLVHNGTSWVTLPKGVSSYVLTAGAATNSWRPPYVPLVTYFFATADAAAANTTNETSLLSIGVGSKTLSADTINIVGRTLNMRVRGMISNFTGSPTLTIRFKLGGTIFASGVLTVVNATDNDFDFVLQTTTRSTGTGGTIALVGSFTHSNTTGGVGRVPLVFAGTQIIDLTTSKIIDVTAQWSVAHASNAIVAQIASIELRLP